jgi:hypothetical protein
MVPVPVFISPRNRVAQLYPRALGSLYIVSYNTPFRTRRATMEYVTFTQPGGPGPRIYIPQEQGGPVISPGTGFPLHRLLRLVS